MFASRFCYVIRFLRNIVYVTEHEELEGTHVKKRVTRIHNMDVIFWLKCTSTIGDPVWCRQYPAPPNMMLFDLAVDGMFGTFLSARLAVNFPARVSTCAREMGICRKMIEAVPKICKVSEARKGGARQSGA